jgi:hypothetical protein
MQAFILQKNVVFHHANFEGILFFQLFNNTQLGNNLVWASCYTFRFDF